MRSLERRVEALEGPSGFYSIGELLDHVDGAPLPAGKQMHLGLAQQFDEMTAADEPVVAAWALGAAKL